MVSVRLSLGTYVMPRKQNHTTRLKYYMGPGGSLNSQDLLTNYILHRCIRFEYLMVFPCKELNVSLKTIFDKSCSYQVVVLVFTQGAETFIQVNFYGNFERL